MRSVAKYRIVFTEVRRNKIRSTICASNNIKLTLLSLSIKHRCNHSYTLHAANQGSRTPVQCTALCTTTRWLFLKWNHTNPLERTLGAWNKTVFAFFPGWWWCWLNQTPHWRLFICCIVLKLSEFIKLFPVVWVLEYFVFHKVTINFFRVSN